MYLVIDSDDGENVFEDESYARTFMDDLCMNTLYELSTEYNCVLSTSPDGASIYGKDRFVLSIYDQPLWGCKLHTTGTLSEGGSVEVYGDGEKDK
jgi:hypothetical protein